MKLLRMSRTKMKSPRSEFMKEAGPGPAAFFKWVTSWLIKIWNCVVRRVISQQKSLTVCETAALGERRFVSVIQFESQRFLIGSSPSSVVLLSRLRDAATENELLFDKGGPSAGGGAEETSSGRGEIG